MRRLPLLNFEDNMTAIVYSEMIDDAKRFGSEEIKHFLSAQPKVERRKTTGSSCTKILFGVIMAEMKGGV